MDTNIIHTGDCFDVLTDLPDESVHAVVSDPPYGLAFMGRDWDDFEPKEYQEWCEKWARECLRVLKPGGHMLAFSGNRTHHRLFTGVEDAGFEIRDTLTWHYGSGFPKASDISKTIDKRKYQFDHDISEFQDYIQERREDKGLSTRDVAEHFADEGQEPTGCVWNWENEQLPDWENYNQLKEILDLDDRFDELMAKESADREKIGEGDAGLANGMSRENGSHDVGYNESYDVTAPATEDAKKWDGWKTGLKPSTEFVVMARKPYDGATVDSVLEHGTGALNINACRIGTDEDLSFGVDTQREDTNKYGDRDDPTGNGQHTEGRYPSNLMFDELAAEQLDAKVGELSTGDLDVQYEDEGTHIYGEWGRRHTEYSGDTGGPSRYFYTSKASRSERTLDGKIDNAHPTVKPGDLMQWLVKLVTAENQIVLDPFCGSGTTLRAAKDLNRQFIGIERQAKWADVARVRAGLTPEDPSIVRDDAGQSGLEAYKVTQ